MVVLVAFSPPLALPSGVCGTLIFSLSRPCSGGSPRRLGGRATVCMFVILVCRELTDLLVCSAAGCGCFGARGGSRERIVCAWGGLR